jgi:hypothetical protein
MEQVGNKTLFLKQESSMEQESGAGRKQKTLLLKQESSMEQESGAGRKQNFVSEARKQRGAGEWSR